MKIGLLYFTGTGVTAKFAHDIGKGFENNLHTVEYIRIKKNEQFDITNFDIIGVGSPAYSFRAPRITTYILKKINFLKKPFFIFCTSGGMPGNTLWNLYRSIKKSGSICLGFLDGVGITNLRSWMPERSSFKQTLSGLGSNYTTLAYEFARTILKRFDESVNIENKKQFNDWLPKFDILTFFWSLFFTWSWQMALYVGRKKVDKNKCNKCGICAEKICPSGAIRLTENKIPIFNELVCIGCSGCVNLCPVDAIWTKNSKNKLQYNIYKKYIL